MEVGEETPMVAVVEDVVVGEVAVVVEVVVGATRVEVAVVPIVLVVTLVGVASVPVDELTAVKPKLVKSAGGKEYDVVRVKVAWADDRTDSAFLLEMVGEVRVEVVIAVVVEEVTSGIEKVASADDRTVRALVLPVLVGLEGEALEHLPPLQLGADSVTVTVYDPVVNTGIIKSSDFVV